MKKALITIAALASLASADNKFFGLGLATGLGNLGNDFALHGRLWVSPPNAVDVSANWSSKSFSLMGEYKWFQYKDIQIQNGRLPWYFGVGGFLNASGNVNGIGVRVPVGLSWEPAGIPFDFFGEVGAAISTGSSDPGVDAKIGFHWYWM